MFDFLDRSRVNDVLTAGHHALQFVRQWAAAAIHAGRSATITNLPPKQAELATLIVDEIEARESVRITDLPQSKVDEYVRVLSKRMHAVALREFRIDRDRGRSLLEDLQADKA